VSAEDRAPAGDHPSATPPEPNTGGRPSSGGPAGNEQAGAGESGATRRRRGSRGGRHRRKPAEPQGAAAAGNETEKAEPAQRRSARPAAPLKGLPTTPLIPIASPTAGSPTPGKTRSRAERKAVGEQSGAGSAGTPAEPAAVADRTLTQRRASASADAAPAQAASVTPTPAAATTGGAQGAAAEAGGDAAAPKRRHRGSRGGRRRHKAADAVHDEVVREAEEAGTDGAPVTSSVSALPTPTPEVSPESKPQPARRGRRRKPPASAATAVAEAAALPAAAATPTEQPPGRVTAGSSAITAPAEPPSPVAKTEDEGPATEEAGQTGDEAAAPKRRRRGARGGRRAREMRVGEDEAAPVVDAERPSSAPAADEAGEAVKPAAPATREAKSRGRDRRRPKAIVRQDEGSGLATPMTAPSPKRLGVVADQPKRKLILVTDDGQELRVALVEDGRLAEIYIERPDKKSYLGDIYQGKVESVLGGIDAAFVDFGLEKNGFLYVDEVTAPEGEKRPRRIGDALKNGQQVLVQVTKDPMGSKGARLSTKISLAGRYLVYVPGGSGAGVSRRLGQGERERLRDISRELKPKNAGLIVRTIAEGHGLEDLKRDLRYLARLWSRLKKKAETVKAPGLVHKEVDISIEVARDLFNDTCESLIVDDGKRHKAIVSFLDKEAPELLPKVHLHTGDEPLFEAYGIEDQIAKALERRVPLSSGGNLVIDHAEALTVIDVNTGRFTRGKGLEDTITKTNLEAAREVVRQLRLRDIGGIIIIDFIDMAHAKNREMVLATLEAELETDRTKTYVVELSPLGLVEMTRQNTTDGARGILTRTCPACLGKARVMSDETMTLNVERRVRTLARRSQARAWLIEVSGGVAERLSGDRLKKLEKEIGRRVFFEGAAGLPVDTFRVLSEGTAAHVQEQRIPVKEGQEVEVELEFSLTYSPRDAVGYIDGYMVIVEGGRQSLGTRRTVRITDTARTGAYATVLKQGSN
jgi:ribonuclease G